MALSLSERDKKIIWHPYTAQKYAREAIPVIKGEGVWLTDETGHRFIDAISSWWVTIHGHSNPYIASRIHEQALTLEQVIFAGFTHLPAIELGERLLSILPGEFAKIFYSDDGSTSTEVAIKMALQYWWNKDIGHRSKILAFTNSYHGDTFGAMSVSERGLFTLAFRDKLFDVIFIPPPSADKPNIPDEDILSQCACVIYEPLLQGAGGMNIYDADALSEFLTICKKHDVICIADEVLTGFGRTGKLFASSWSSTAPDIICLSKGLTGGTMALGVTACTQKIYEAFDTDDRNKTFFHGHSFTANPIACAAALASLDLLQQKECAANLQRIVQRNSEFTAVLNSIKEKLNIRNIRHCGTIVAFEVNEEQRNYSSGLRDIFTDLAMKKGVYLRPLGNTVYIMPPYCINDSELDQVYAAIIDALSEIRSL